MLRDVPTLAIVHEVDSISLLHLARIYSGWMDIVWAVDDARLTAADRRQLGRFGRVCDIGGSVHEAAAVLASAGVDGVTTFADAQLVRTAEIAEILRLPGNPPEVANRLVDKGEQRRALAAAGVPVPEFVELGVATEPTSFDAVRYPAVLKPTVGAGGRTTFAAPDAGAAAWQLAALRAAGDLRPMILEECLGEYPPGQRGEYGDYVSVEPVVGPGVVHTVQVVGRMPLAAEFRETGAFAPAGLCPERSAELAATVADAAAALGIRTGCLHTEIKLTADGPRIIEVNGRIGGGGVPGIVADTTGVSLYRCAALAAVGAEIEPELDQRGPRNGVSFAIALQPPLDTPVALTPGWSEVLHGIDGVRQIDVRAEQATVGHGEGSYGYLVMLAGRAESPERMLEAYRTLYSVMRPLANAQ